MQPQQTARHYSVPAIKILHGQVYWCSVIKNDMSAVRSVAYRNKKLYSFDMPYDLAAQLSVRKLYKTISVSSVFNYLGRPQKNKYSGINNQNHIM